MGILLLAVLAGFSLVHEGAAKSESESNPNRVILLELFTSQGCSSCPPADRILSELASDPLVGPTVIPLAFHVDYWNRIGWADPFSDQRFSKRQRRYGRSFGLRSVYTPQLVIQGRRQMIGSRERAIRETLRELSEVPAGATLAISATRRGDSAEIGVRWKALRRTTEPVDLFVVLIESDLITEVAMGENRGRTLHNDFVVRAFERVDAIDFEQEREGTRNIEVDLATPWKRDNLRAVAFLQDGSHGEIHAATWTPLR